MRVYVCMLRESLEGRAAVLLAVVGDKHDCQEEYFDGDDNYYPYEELGCDEECWKAVLYTGHVTCRHDVCCITGSAY